MFSDFLPHSPLTAAAEVLAIAIVIWLALTSLIWWARGKNNDLDPSVRFARNLLLPTSVLLYLCMFVLRLPRLGTTFRLVETIFWVEVLWVVLSMTRAMLLPSHEHRRWKVQVPELLIDILRIATIIIGSGMIIAGVWGGDFTGLLATVGVGSIVIGLALQDTLGSLMSGIALLFERPFQIGDWVKAGEFEGQVIELNWRAVRFRTRSQDMVVIPNSVIAKERLANFSRPTTLHGVDQYIGFSFDDPPNKVRRILRETALLTHGVRADPSPIVRTAEFRDFYINYQIKLFIDDYAALQDIQQDFLTRVWYAARRNSLTIPFPIRSIYTTDVPAQSAKNGHEVISATLAKIPLFAQLQRGELQSLAQDAILLEFAAGERVVYQGDIGDSLYIVKHGEAIVSHSDAANIEREVARLKPGQFFGEMALLTGEPRSANVNAAEDLQVIVVYKDALRLLLENRPAIAEELAKIVQERSGKLEQANVTGSTESAQRKSETREHNSLASRIKRFLSI